MQVGAFMNVLDEDARTVSGVTGLNLQMSGSGCSPPSMRTVTRSTGSLLDRPLHLERGDHHFLAEGGIAGGTGLDAPVR